MLESLISLAVVFFAGVFFAKKRSKRATENKLPNTERLEDEVDDLDSDTVRDELHSGPFFPAGKD